MDKIDRIVQLHRLLASRRTHIALRDLQERLQCSRATTYRLVAFLRDVLQAPIEHDGDTGGIRCALLP